MTRNNTTFGYYGDFAQSALVIIIRDILELGIIIPKLIIDYDLNPNIKNGYYMYQNPAGDHITLNMHLILSLENEDNIKTVITYGFIHEIMHMHQKLSSKYQYDRDTYTLIEDSADYSTIKFIRENIDLINKRLNFNFNDIFLKGIERQLKHKIEVSYYNNRKTYIIKTISGALCGKLNIAFDTVFNELFKNFAARIIFPNGREYNIDLLYSNTHELDLLINLIYITDFKLIHFDRSIYYNADGTEDCSVSILRLI